MITRRHVAPCKARSASRPPFPTGASAPSGSTWYVPVPSLAARHIPGQGNQFGKLLIQRIAKDIEPDLARIHIIDNSAVRLHQEDIDRQISATSPMMFDKRYSGAKSADTDPANRWSAENRDDG